MRENDVRSLHKLVMRRSAPEIAGKYADSARYVRTETGQFRFPSPAEIPALMGDFASWMAAAPNLILIRSGYPPIPVRPEDRLRYIHALQRAQAGIGVEDFNALLYERLDATLEEYLSAVEEAQD